MGGVLPNLHGVVIDEPVQESMQVGDDGQQDERAGKNCAGVPESGYYRVPVCVRRIFHGKRLHGFLVGCPALAFSRTGIPEPGLCITRASPDYA